jgi:NTP pyrophosphatase (non-canonical NTP hydrolase)
MTRDEVSKEEVQNAIQEVLQKYAKRLKKKGYGAFAGAHEIYGVLTEEVDEVLDEVRANNNELFCQELIDCAVVCLFGVASIRNKNKLDAARALLKK